MYCRNCGAELPEGAVVCSSCGCLVSEEEKKLLENYEREKNE